MAEKKQMILNRLPAPTWNWLRVNRTVLDWENENEIDLGAVVRSVQGKENEPLRLEIRGEGEYSRKDVDVTAEPDSAVTIIETFGAEQNLLVRTHLTARRNATVRLVQIQNTQEGSRLVSAVEGECEEGGRIELYQVLAGKGDMPTCRKLAESVIADGSAFEKCCQMFAAQGGDISVLRDADKFQKAKYSYELTAPTDGYIYKNDVEKIGNASVLLGAGRIKKEDSIDFAAGITMHKKLGDYVKAGESICTFYADDESLFAAAEEMYRGGLVIRDEPPTLPPLVYARVTSDGVERF